MMVNRIGMLYDQINEGILPPSVELEAFNTELSEIIRPLKKRTDYEELADICYDMAACAQRYGFTCGFKQEICLEVSCYSQEYGFTSGFKYGVAFMMECLE